MQALPTAPRAEEQDIPLSDDVLRRLRESGL